MKRKKRFVPYFIVGIAVLSIAWWIFTPKRDSELALKQFVGSMVEDRGLGCARISNGTQLLSEKQAAGVMRDIIRPMFAGVQIDSVKVERAGEGNSMALITARTEMDVPIWVALNAFDLEDGGAIPLFTLLQRCWQAPVISKLGRYPTSESAFDSAYYKGIKEAAPKLNSLGLGEIFGPKGVYMSPNEIESFYAERMKAK